MGLLDRLTRRYKLLKWRALAKLRPSGTVAAVVHGKVMHLDLSDRVHCEMLYTTGLWEQEVTNYLSGLLREGMVVVDIGANVGYYALLAACKVGASGHVFAFEPEPSRFGLLKKNIDANRLTNIVPIPKAVSNKTGTTPLFLNPRHNKADHRLFDSFEKGHASESVAVETTRLDDYFKGANVAIHVIKMDIQGAEMAALEGMADTIHRQENLTLITEFWPDGLKACGYAPDGFLNRLSELGFRFHVFDDPAGSIRRIDPEEIMKMSESEIYLACQKGVPIQL